MIFDRWISLLLVVTGFFIGTGCNWVMNTLLTPTNPEIQVVNSSPLGLGGPSVTFVASLEVSNPNFGDITITHLDYKISLGGHHFASGQLEDKIRILAHEKARVPLSYSVNWTDIMLTALADYLLSVQTAEVTIVGKVAVREMANISLPFSLKSTVAVSGGTPPAP